MSEKTKKYNVRKFAKTLSNDFYVQYYLLHSIEFDTGIWCYADNGIVLLPYSNEVWLENKIWFPTVLNMNKFCMLCGCSVIMESGDNV